MLLNMVKIASQGKDSYWSHLQGLPPTKSNFYWCEKLFLQWGSNQGVWNTIPMLNAKNNIRNNTCVLPFFFCIKYENSIHFAMDYLLHPNALFHKFVDVRFNS